jgi:phage I-like protein
MKSLNSLYIKKEILQKLLHVLEKKQEKGVEITISISDEKDKYNQNISAYVSQTKEQRESKKERFYVGNGKTFWTDETKPEVKQPDPKVIPAGDEFEDVSNIPF